MAQALPAASRIVIVGGGAMGTSLAYHLVRHGHDEVLLLEQGELAGGSTWHAAGMVGRLRTSNSLTRINKESVELYSRLEAETGVSCSWRQTGSLIVGRSEERMVQLRRTVAMAEVFGVEAEIIDRDRCAELWPHMDAAQVLGGAWLPHDGRVVPQDLVASLAAGARSRGAVLQEGVRVTEVLREGDRVVGVRTDQGDVSAEHVALCGGMWTRDLAARCGLTVPLWPVEHHYVVSEPIAGTHDDLPMLRDPDLKIYVRPEGDRMMLGAFQDRSKPWDVDPVPGDFSFGLFEPDWPGFADPLAAGRKLIPALRDAEFPDFINGPESFTPDNSFILGPGPGVDGLWSAAGLTRGASPTAGGAGRVLAEWMTEGSATMDLWSVDPTRFGAMHNDPSFLQSRVGEVLGLHYQMAWPNREMETGRGLLESPLHDSLAARGACFGQRAGWERPNWFARPGEDPVNEYAWGRQNWHGAVAEEVRAVREGVALFDQSSFGKIRVSGPESRDLLQRLCANNVDVDPGKLVYTAMLNQRGTFESDLTVLRLPDCFILVTSSGQRWHDLAWVRANARGMGVEVEDVTQAVGVIGIMGPHTRALMSRLTDHDLGNESFPFGTAQRFQLAGATVSALRITYVGELGYEVHVDPSDMVRVHTALHEAGEDLGLRDAGHYAVNACRLEKAYRAWGAELSPDDTPVQAGLSMFCDLSKDFLGREVVVRQRESGVTRRLVQLVLEDPEPVLWGQEPILRDGAVVGHTTSGAYGHTLGGAVGLGYVRGPERVTKDWLVAGRYDVVVNGHPVSARASLRPAYDPKSARVRC